MTMKKLLVLHDFSEPADRALRFANGLARQLGAQLELAYVLPDLYDGRAEELAGLPTTIPGQTERYLAFLRSELQERARSLLKDEAVPFATHIGRGDPVKRIEALAGELSVDALCVGATGKGAVARTLLGSVSQALLRTSPIPVILVP